MTEYSNPYSQSEYPAKYSDPVLTTTESVGDGTSDASFGASEVEGSRPLPGSGPDDSDASMKDKASQSAEAGKQAASEVASTAAEKAKDVAQETKAQARNVLGQAQDQLKQQTQAQHGNLVNNLRSLADQLSSMAQGSEQSGYATDLVGQAADRAHGAASWLDAREPAQLVDEARRFARQKPGSFILGALAAGVVAGRLTRGVVAVHKDDSGDHAPIPSGYVADRYATGGISGYAAPVDYTQPADYGTTTGYGTTGYETTGYAGGPSGAAPVGGIEP